MAYILPLRSIWVKEFKPLFDFRGEVDPNLVMGLELGGGEIDGFEFYFSIGGVEKIGGN